jgi:hypothetical protein
VTFGRSSKGSVLHKAAPAIFAAVMIGSPVGASALPLPGDHIIVPGSRIGEAELGPADQGALFRQLGEPAQTERRGDREYYMYGSPDPGELVVDFDLAKDEPFEISTASAAYHTREGLGVGSSEQAIQARLGPPLCMGGNVQGDGLMVYGSIWFLMSRGTVTKVSIREHMSPDDFKNGAVHC